MEYGSIDEETTEAFESYTRANASLKLQLSSFTNLLKEERVASNAVNELLSRINETPLQDEFQ